MNAPAPSPLDPAYDSDDSIYVDDIDAYVIDNSIYVDDIDAYVSDDFIYVDDIDAFLLQYTSLEFWEALSYGDGDEWSNDVASDIRDDLWIFFINICFVLALCLLFPDPSYFRYG